MGLAIGMVSCWYGACDVGLEGSGESTDSDHWRACGWKPGMSSLSFHYSSYGLVRQNSLWAYFFMTLFYVIFYEHLFNIFT